VIIRSSVFGGRLAPASTMDVAALRHPLTQRRFAGRASFEHNSRNRRAEIAKRQNFPIGAFEVFPREAFLQRLLGLGTGASRGESARTYLGLTSSQSRIG
jgi:hypothetical protein